MEATTEWIMKLILEEGGGETTEVEPFFTIWLFIGSILCFLAGALCAGGGIGGGAFYIPIFVLVLGLDPHLAVPLSKVTTFGIAIGGYIVNARKRHPNLDRPIINYDLAMLMEPTTLIGTVIGVYLNVMSPAYVILICLLLLLTWTSYETLKKARSTYRNEVREEAEKAKEKSTIEMENLIGDDDENSLDRNFSIDDDDDDINNNNNNNINRNNDLNDNLNEEVKVNNSLNNDNNLNDNLNDLHDNNDDNNKDDDNNNNNNNNNKEGEGEVEFGVDFSSLSELDKEKRREEMKREESKTPFHKLAILFVVWFGFLVLILLKGGSGESIIGVECGTMGYWLIVLAEIPYLLSFAAIYGIFLRYKEKEKEEIGFKIEKGDVKWTGWNTTWLPIASIVAGVAAGFLGIGGGMVKGPIMLAINVIPQVATATSSFMIMFTASATSIQFMIMGKITIGYAVWYFFVGVFAAIVGQIGLSAIVKKYKKQSLVGFLLGFCIVFSAVAMAGMIVLDMVEGTANMGFQGVCDGDSSA